MSSLQGIIVLCLVAVVAAVAYYTGTINQDGRIQTDSDTGETQIDPPSMELDTGPSDESSDTKEESETATITLPRGTTISLGGQGLTKVPDDVFRRDGVVKLDVSNNNIDGALQAEVRLLSDLIVLDLSNNNFTGVPAEVGQLSKLEVLDLSGNPITGLPYELGNLKNLKVLDLRNTNYSAQDLEIIKDGLPSSVTIYD